MQIDAKKDAAESDKTESVVTSSSDKTESEVASSSDENCNDSAHSEAEEEQEEDESELEQSCPESKEHDGTTNTKIFKILKCMFRPDQPS